MKHLYKYILLLAITACSGDDDNTETPPPPVDSDVPISLTGVMNQNAATGRATMKHPSTPWAAGDNFAVTANYYYSNTTNVAQQFMSESRVTYQVTGSNWYGTTGGWIYSPVKYWPQQGYLDLFAVHPADYLPNLDRQRWYHEDLSNTILKTRFYLSEPKPATSPGTPNEKYSDAEEQWDLMFSHRPTLSKPDHATPVKFTFTHAEMAVRFWTKFLDVGNAVDMQIDKISLNNIHTGGLITATDITDWQAYYAEQPSGTSTAGNTTPVKLMYNWNWDGTDLNDDVRKTYYQTMNYVWAYSDGTGLHQQPEGQQINPGNKVFIIPPQCLGAASGSSITVWYTYHDLAGDPTTNSTTFYVEQCGEPGDVLDIYLRCILDTSGTTYKIEIATATLTPWEDIKGNINADLEQ